MSDRTQLAGHAEALAMTEAMHEWSGFSIEAIDAFAKTLAGMSDEQMRTEFHASDSLIASLRELQATCGF